jgi:hypothetical protein
MQVYFPFALVVIACLASRVAAGSGGCGECTSADPCSRPDLAGKFCEPYTATVIEASPCDENNPALSHRGWYCLPNTGTVLVYNEDFDKQSTLTWMRPAVPAGADPGALILDPDYTTVQSVPCDENNPAVAGQWCEPNTANVVEQCKPCGDKIGLTCRPERGGFGIGKYCMSGSSATLDINRWVVKGTNYTFLFLPPHHLGSAPPPTTDKGANSWLYIVEATVGVFALAAFGGITLFMDEAEAVLPTIAKDIALDVDEELNNSIEFLEQDIRSVVSFQPGATGFNWQVIMIDSDNNVLGAQNAGVNLFKSPVGGIKLSNGFEVRW